MKLRAVMERQSSEEGRNEEHHCGSADEAHQAGGRTGQIDTGIGEQELSYLV